MSEESPIYGSKDADSGLPETYLAECPLTADGKQQAIGNGVPLPLGNAIARAVRAAVVERPDGRLELK